MIDTTNIPVDFDTMILEAFKKFTHETREKYMYQDKLAFIDMCVKYLHNAHDSHDVVKMLILRNVKWQLDEYEELPDADEFWDMSFMEACYEQGQMDASLYDHYTGDHHIDDVIMDLLVRVIKTVMNYEVSRYDN